MTTGLIVCAAVLIAATAFGLWRRRSDGRIRDLPVRPVADDAPPVNLHSASRAEHGGEVLSQDILGAPLGTRATLVQFSTAFCQPCRATRRILDEVAGMVDGTAHVEIDAEAHLDLVRQLDIRRTPTVLILDESGAIVKRATGLPRKADVIAALGEIRS
jgi:thiol-disulfide isomerase/thioredoxin